MPVRPRQPRLVLVLLLAIPLMLLSASAAGAAWSAPGAGSAAGAAATMPTGTAPAGTVAGAAVTVTWSAAQLSSGAVVAGYLISRFNADTGAPATVGAGCSGVITTTTCTEQSVPSGTWVYTDTPVQLSWTGGASPQSPPVEVTT